MVALVCDPQLERDLIARRRESGADRYDEVWEGVYVMSPMPNDEHQNLVTSLSSVLMDIIQWAGLGEVRAGVNISDRKEDWQSNFRCPDIAVFRNETAAENCEAFWYGGPDFVVEVVSPGDRTREKLGFYAQVGTRELLLVDRNPWQLELYRLQEGTLQRVGISTVEESQTLQSESVSLSFRLLPGEKRPQIKVSHPDGRIVRTV